MVATVHYYDYTVRVRIIHMTLRDERLGLSFAARSAV